MLKWLKIFLIKKGISKLDELELPIALKIKEAQAKFGEIPPEQFSRELVDAFQAKMYEWCGVSKEDRPKGDN